MYSYNIPRDQSAVPLHSKCVELLLARLVLVAYCKRGYNVKSGVRHLVGTPWRSRIARIYQDLKVSRLTVRFAMGLVGPL